MKTIRRAIVVFVMLLPAGLAPAQTKPASRPAPSADEAEVRDAGAIGEVQGNKNSGGTTRIFDVRLVRAGDAFVVAYQQEDRSVHNGKTVTDSFMYLDTYARRNGAWMLVASSETPIEPIPDPARAVRVDPRVLDTYAGQYRFQPENLLTVWRDGDHLMGKATKDDEPTRFYAESDTVFFDEGHSWRWVFVKDATGKVNIAIFRYRGRDYEMPRVK